MYKHFPPLGACQGKKPRKSGLEWAGLIFLLNSTIVRSSAVHDRYVYTTFTRKSSAYTRFLTGNCLVRHFIPKQISIYSHQRPLKKCWFIQNNFLVHNIEQAIISRHWLAYVRVNYYITSHVTLRICRPLLETLLLLFSIVAICLLL